MLTHEPSLEIFTFSNPNLSAGQRRAKIRYYQTVMMTAT